MMSIINYVSAWLNGFNMDFPFDFDTLVKLHRFASERGVLVAPTLYSQAEDFPDSPGVCFGMNFEFLFRFHREDYQDITRMVHTIKSSFWNKNFLDKTRGSFGELSPAVVERSKIHQRKTMDKVSFTSKGYVFNSVKTLAAEFQFVTGTSIEDITDSIKGDLILEMLDRRKSVSIFLKRDSERNGHNICLATRNIPYIAKGTTIKKISLFDPNYGEISFCFDLDNYKQGMEIVSKWLTDYLQYITMPQSVIIDKKYYTEENIKNNFFKILSPAYSRPYKIADGIWCANLSGYDVVYSIALSLKHRAVLEYFAGSQIDDFKMFAATKHQSRKQVEDYQYNKKQNTVLHNLVINLDDHTILEKELDKLIESHKITQEDFLEKNADSMSPLELAESMGKNDKFLEVLNKYSSRLKPHIS